MRVVPLSSRLLPARVCSASHSEQFCFCGPRYAWEIEQKTGEKDNERRVGLRGVFVKRTALYLLNIKGEIVQVLEKRVFSKISPTPLKCFRNT